ncbi:MAG: UvrD-helicase domain-containing protein [Patescibacteria group bacterium]|nr:UvrD-helicase domain-containing protein [Patescibacteria group bacterium]
MKDILKDLNPEQKKAVTTIDGPILILAGAGSGKTRVITYRIAYLISQGISAQNILAVTFTNKAAGEMKERIIKLLGEKKLGLWIGTFHSICARILRREIKHIGFESNFSIYDTSDQISLIKEILKLLGIDEKMFNPNAVSSKISSIKNELISPITYSNNFANSYFDQKVAEVYEVYEKELKKRNALDFDDLISKTIEVLDLHPEILERYRKMFQYILVDEYQDTNRSQYLLVKMLTNNKNNICVVGDPDQSIYNFRGADIRNILNFEKDHPNTKIFKLEENYRSTKNILNCAQGLIEKNKQRKKKDIWTKNEAGEMVTVFQAFNQIEEGEYIVSEIRKILRFDKKATLNDMVVFYRTHAQSRALEEVFLNNSTPYRIIGGVSFYARREVKDILSYLNILNNPADLTSLKRIINVPTRGIGLGAMKYLVGINNINDIKDLLEKVDPRTKKGLEKFYNIYRKLKEESSRVVVSDLISAILKDIEYKDHLIDGTHEGESRWENVKELMSVAKRFDDLNPNESLASFLQDVSLITSADNQDYNKESISLMTLHSAKGLEFDYVFIVGMEENIFPHAQSMTDEHDLEEERRLCYVGITRAKKRLYFIYTNSRMLYGGVQSNPPSRFLEEMPSELLRYSQ